MLRILPLIMLLFGLLALASPGVVAAAQFTVSVQVVARALATVSGGPAVLEIAADDIARGYIDLAEEVRLHARSNNPAGYRLRITDAAKLFDAIELTTAGTSIVFAEDSWLTRPYHRAGEVLQARVRIRSGPGVRPGCYDLRLQVSAEPL